MPCGVLMCFPPKQHMTSGEGKQNVYIYLCTIYNVRLSVKYYEKSIAKALGELREGTDHFYYGRARKTLSKW